MLRLVAEAGKHLHRQLSTHVGPAPQLAQPIHARPFGADSAHPAPVVRIQALIPELTTPSKPLFNTQKFQRLAELEARVQKAIEEAGGRGLDWAEEELGRAAALAGLDLAAARLLDVATLEALLGAGDPEAAGRLWLTAETLYLDGLVATRQGRQAEARDRLAKARRLFAGVPEGVRLPDEAAPPADRIAAIDRLG